MTGGWLVTYTLSQHAFEPTTVKSVSFTGPSADTLMGLINSPSVPLGFDIGLVPGVFAGSLLAALIGREWKLQGFHDGLSMGRYAAGAFLMGFGGMLAGGCAVGAGVTGGCDLRGDRVAGAGGDVARCAGDAYTDRARAAAANERRR